MLRAANKAGVCREGGQGGGITFDGLARSPNCCNVANFYRTSTRNSTRAHSAFKMLTQHPKKSFKQWGSLGILI